MTRDEAIGTLMGMGRSTTLDDLFVDRLVALGLLKLDELNPEDEIRKILLAYVAPSDAMALCDEFTRAGFQLTKGPVSRHTYAEDLYRDALERVACAVDKRYIVMHTEAGEHTETVYGFIRRTLASVSK